MNNHGFVYILGAIVLIAAICILLITLLGHGFFEDPYWETKTEFGGYAEELIIIYSDGTEESVKSKLDSFSFLNPTPMTVSHEGKTITKIIYKLFASADGTTGYDKVYVDMSELETVFQMRFGPNLLEDWYVPIIKYADYVYVTADTQFQQIGYREFDVKTNIEQNSDIYPTGTYRFDARFKGTLKYKGEGDTDWQSIYISATDEELLRTLVLDVYRDSDNPTNDNIGIQWGATEKYNYA